MATKKQPVSGYRATVQAAHVHVLQQIEDLEGRHADALSEFEKASRQLEQVQATASPHREAGAHEWDLERERSRAEQVLGDLQRELIDLRREKAALSAILNAAGLLAKARAELFASRQRAVALRRELAQVETVAGKLRASVREAGEALTADLQAHAEAMVGHGGPLPTPEAVLRLRADLEGQQMACDTAEDRAQRLRVEIVAADGQARDARDEAATHQAAVATSAALEIVHQYLPVFATAAAAQAGAGFSFSDRYEIKLPAEAVSAAREALEAELFEQPK